MHDTPIAELEKRFAAQKNSPDASVVRELVGVAVTVARRKPAAEQAAWYSRAVATYDRLRALAPDARGPEQDFAAEAEYALVAADIAKSWPDEGKKKCPAATLHDLFGGPTEGPSTPGTASTGKWRELAQKT